MTHPIRILIVDDHPMVAQGIQSVLESYDTLEVVGTLGNGRDVVEQLETLNPDVILMDLNMPEMGGLTATEMVLEQRPGTRVLVLSMHDSPEYISSALNHGAMGYILKDVPTDEIKLAIDSVMRGRKIPVYRRGRITGAETGQPEGSPDRARANSIAAIGEGQIQQGRGPDARHLGAYGRDAPQEHQTQTRHFLHRRTDALRDGARRAARDRKRAVRL